VPWLKVLHLVTVIVWCGALLYLTVMIANTALSTPGAARAVPLPRRVYIGVTTPAALLAIVSGTLIFVTQGLVAPWLMLKLAIVGLLALGHGACGLLILRTERGQHAGVRAACYVLTLAMLLWLLGIAWLVLYKPA
jgi:protoporphyrinogen IX oxidase